MKIQNVNALKTLWGMDCDLIGQTTSGGGQGRIATTLNRSVNAKSMQMQSQWLRVCIAVTCSYISKEVHVGYSVRYNARAQIQYKSINWLVHIHTHY